MLFGATTPADRAGRRWLARHLALAGGLALVMLARRPDSILRAQFWAEDGNVFFYQQLTLGFWPAVRTLYGGFPFLVQRLVAAFASGLPTVAIPVAHNAGAIAITALSMATFALPGFRHLVRSDALRAAVCVATLCIPAGQELLATPTTLGYFLAILLIYLSVMRTPRTLAGSIVWCLGGALAVLSTQLAAVAAPLWLLRAARGVSRRHGPDLAFAAIQTAALLVVIGVAGGMAGVAGAGKGTELAGGMPVSVWSPGYQWSVLRALGWVMASCIDSAFLPMAVFQRLETLGTLPIVVPAVLVAVCAALAFRDLSDRGRVTLCLAIYVYVSSLYLVVAGRPIIVQILHGAVPSLRPSAFPALGPRHRALPNVAFLLATAAIIDGAQRLPMRVAVAAVACAGLLFAWTPEFRVPPFPDLQWPLWAARLDQKLASGSREALVIPSYPRFFDIAVDSSPSSAPNPARTRGQPDEARPW